MPEREIKMFKLEIIDGKGIFLNGVKIEPVIDWSVESDIGATIIPDGNSVKVKCTNDINCVGKAIIIKATVGNSVGECLLTVIGGA